MGPEATGEAPTRPRRPGGLDPSGSPRDDRAGPAARPVRLRAPSRPLQAEERDAHPPRRGRLALVVGRELDLLAGLPEELEGGEVERIEGPDRRRERLEGALQDGGSELDEGDAREEGADRFLVGAREAPRVHAGPHFVLEQPARDDAPLPQPIRRNPVLGEEGGEGDRAVDVDHRSSRSPSSSRRILRRGATGTRGGGPAPTRAGGVTHPSRTAWARRASARTGLRPSRGGESSATTRSRSTTRTVSPRSARRTYSLRRFLRTLIPTARMDGK